MSDGHVVIVLAAGGSERLGRPKQLLMRDGETLVHRAARIALETAPASVYVVVGAAGDDVIDAVRDLPCRIVPNTAWHEGLASSLRAAGDAFAMDGMSAQQNMPVPLRPVLIMACDQPAIDVAHLQALLDGAAHATSRCAATRHGDAVGVPAVVPLGWFNGDERPGGDAGFGRALRDLPAGSLALLDIADLRLDIDTPGDLREAIARGWLDPS